MTASTFWDEPDTRRAVLARLPAYRLTKFQDCLPELFALEVIERYLLDVEGTVRWLGGAAEPSASKRRPRVQLRLPGGDVPRSLLPALQCRWGELPDRLSVDELNALAHMVQGYEIARDYLGRDAFDVARDLREGFAEKRRWEGSAVELLAGFFAVVRGWRGLYDGPHDGDEHHQEAQSLYEAVRQRLLEHPDEVELVPARAEPPDES